MNEEQTVIEYIGNKESPNRAKVLINGTELKGIRSITFEHSAGSMPEIDIVISDFADESIFEIERAKVLIRKG